MRQLDTKKRAQIVACLVEGNSLRSTCRITGAARDTVTKLLVDLVKACAQYHDRFVRNVACKRIECDEVWSFCHAKEKNVPAEFKGQYVHGDVWTWTAICADSKLIASSYISDRSAEAAKEFINDLAIRLKHRVQLTVFSFIRA